MARFLLISLLLPCIWLHAQPNLTRRGPCPEDVLILGGNDGLRKLCPGLNDSKYLAEGVFTLISYSPRHGGTVVALRENKLEVFIKINSANATLQPYRTIDLESPSLQCKYVNSGYPHSSFNPPEDITIDWATDIVYVAKQDCGKIYVHDWKRSLYATIYDNPEERVEILATYPKGGYIFWVSTIRLRAGYSISRSRMDGREVKLLIPAGTNIDSMAVDDKTAMIFWTNKYKGRDLVNFAVLANIMYRLEYDPEGTSSVLYRTEDRQDSTVLILNGTRIFDLVVFPATEDLIFNPCANNSCSHICVQSSPRRYSCLCDEDHLLHQDGHSCKVRTSLWISSSDGLLQIPASPDPPGSQGTPLPLNATNPSHVQCDDGRNRVLWAEKGPNVGGTRIVQVQLDRLEQGTEVVFERARAQPGQPDEELEAFALDVITGNLYMIFRAHRRILVCNVTLSGDVLTDGRCAELFGNQVAPHIDSLALQPDDALMYWIQEEDENAVILQGGMNGLVLEVLRSKGLRLPTSIAINSLNRDVYWIDLVRQRIEYTTSAINKGPGFMIPSKSEHFLPQRILIHDMKLYWLGLEKDGRSEAIFSMDFNPAQVKSSLESRLVWKVELDGTNGNNSRVTGWSMMDPYSVRRDSRLNHCGQDHPCADICLLSNRNSFRCVCPVGFEVDGADGLYCREIQEPTVIYGTRNGRMMMWNASHLSSLTEGPITNIAFDPLRKELLWHVANCSLRENMYDFDCRGRLHWVSLQGNKSKATTTARKFLLQGLGSAKLKLSWLEYDWIGENVYFRYNNYGIGLCGRAKGGCTVLSARGDLGKTLALDPPNGRMYWIIEGPARNAVPEGSLGIYRGAMDGSDGNRIIPSKFPKLLTVHHSSQLLFWVERVGHFSSGYSYQIFHSDLDGDGVRLTISLPSMPYKLGVAGSRVYWTTMGHDTLSSCERDTANNFLTYQLPGLNVALTDFVIVRPNPGIQASWDPCIPGALCSDMCIPTPTGYMRCLCPQGHQLLPDNRTCVCNDDKYCNTSDAENALDLDLRSDPDLNEMEQAVCPGNAFRCMGKCLAVEKICNGFPECQDFSDEGDRCNEVCQIDHGCLHSCSNSPQGPICFCPPEQKLADDGKSCVLFQPESGKLKVGLGVAVVMALVLLTFSFVLTIQYHRAWKKLRNLTEQEVEEFLGGDPEGASVAPDGVDRALLLPYRKVISPADIIIARDAALGSGEFGVVYPGICKSEPVAVKMLKRSVDVGEFKAVLSEVKIMAYLGDHKHVVKFVGAEISQIATRKISIVTELSPHGDLLRYLWKVASLGSVTRQRRVQTVGGDASSVTIFTLYSWCEQIAKGMGHLASKQIVHGDLAARNVLVFKENIVKISDFGLSKQLYGCRKYQMKRKRKLPWRSAAIELFTTMELSDASDVWAFGVTAWEIFSLGQTPYKGMGMSDDFVQYLLSGHRLPKPELASQEAYKVILECWDAERSYRPDFGRLQKIFHDLLAGEMRTTWCAKVKSEGMYVSAV